MPGVDGSRCPTTASGRERRERADDQLRRTGQRPLHRQAVDRLRRPLQALVRPLRRCSSLIAVIGLVWHGPQPRPRVPRRLGVPGLVRCPASRLRVAGPRTPSAAIPIAGAAEVTKVGTGTIRVQTEKLNESEIRAVQTALATEFKTDVSNVSASFVGPSWGASVSQKALKAWSSSSCSSRSSWRSTSAPGRWPSPALVALLHDLFITVGIYALAGFEVSPATMIGFLTILGYSLYDTVVVFDKVRENTTEALGNGRMHLLAGGQPGRQPDPGAVDQHHVVALLPIASILVIGVVFLGAGTLLDLALALFVGIAVGTYSSIFIATPLLVAPAPARARGQSSSTRRRAPLPGAPRRRRRRRRRRDRCRTPPTPSAAGERAGAPSRCRRPPSRRASARRTSTPPAARATSRKRPPEVPSLERLDATCRASAGR